jgi:type VI secretion system protein ImpH
MASQGRRTDPSVEQSLFEQPYEFNFFQAVRMLGLMQPGRQPVGGDNLPHEEIVRFRTHNSLAFPSTSIQEIKPGKQIGESIPPPAMAITFMGFTGRQGVLPFHYTEFVLNRLTNSPSDTTAADFFDMFLHRLVSFFYCTWEKHSIAVQYERPQPGIDRTSSVSQYALDFAGLGEYAIRDGSNIDSATLVFYSGLLAQQPRSSAALEGLLRDYFQVGVQIHQFAGRWVPIDPSDYTDMTRNAALNRLGQGASLGDAAWCPQAKLRIELGPMTRAQYEAFLPPGPGRKGGDALPLLKSWVHLFLDRTIDFEVQLCLQKTDVPDFCLSEVTRTAALSEAVQVECYPCALGLTTWLKTEEFTHDARDVVLQS